MPTPAASPAQLLAIGVKCLALALFSAAVAWVSDYKLQLGPVVSGIAGLSIFGIGLFSMLMLRGSPREMGFTFALKVLSVTGYKILNFVLSMWLIRDLGFDSTQGGLIIVVWGFFMTAATLVSGSLTDVLGLRRTLLLGVSLCVVSRLVMVTSGHPWVALICGLLPLAVGEALCTPVLVAAMRLYSKPSQRSLAFSLFYALMNFGFMFGYFISDGVMKYMAAHDMESHALAGIELSPYAWLIVVSLLVDLLMYAWIPWLRPGVQMTEDGYVELPQRHYDVEVGGNWLSQAWKSVAGAFKEVVRTLGELIHTDGFGKLIVFLLMIGLLKIVFNLMDYMLNPFVAREIGEAAVSKVGRLNATNSILILVLAPLVGMLTKRRASYAMVILGGFITAASFAFMALPSAWFQPAADGLLGDAVGRHYLGIVGAVHPYFVMIFLWQVVFSLGEAFYSPRVYEYAASIAPPGKEASYSSLSYIPLLIGKISTGLAFTALLDRYCPAEGPRQPSMLWLIVGLMVLVAPVGLLVLKKHIRVEEDK